MHKSIEAALVAHKLMGHHVRMYKIRFHKLDGEVNFQCMFLRDAIKVYQDKIVLSLTPRLDFATSLQDVYKKYLGLKMKVEISHHSNFILECEDIEVLAQLLINVENDLNEAARLCPQMKQEINKMNNFANSWKAQGWKIGSLKI